MSYKSINKTLKYSIRKLAVGATPVVIGTFLLAGGATALASDGSGSNVSINYVADSELTDYEKSLVKQGIPEELKNGETYYLVYKNEAYRSNNKLPDTGSTSLPLKGIGFATALLTVVLVSKKNRNKILGIVLIGALGQSVVLPSSTFALENKLLAGYNHTVSANSKFEDNLISIDGYKYVGYLTSDDVSLNSVNTQEYHIQKSIVKTSSTDNGSDEGRVTTKPIEKDIENKPQVKENLTDVVKNSDDNIPLPIVEEEVLSETTKEEEIEVSENENNNNNSFVEKDTSIEKNTNPKAPIVNNATLENEKEKSQTNVNAPIEKSRSDKSNIKEKTNIKASENSVENITIKNNTVETPKNIQDATKSQKDTTTDTSNKANSSLTTDGVKPTKVKKKVKVVERIIKVTETVPYKVVYEEDENMENGTTKVIKEGTVGEKTTIQKVLLNNGEELKREITSSTVKQKEVDKVIKVGTKGVKKHNSKPEINNGPQSAPKTKLIPKKETVYTEIVESKQRKYVKDYPKLEEATKNIKNNIGLLTTQKDKLSTINITNIFDDSLFEGERRFENVMMYYVQANLKRKREFENQEEVIDNIISKEVPVITGVMRIGTRKPGFETLKGDGKLVNISSNLDEKEIKNIKLSNNNSYMLDKEVPGYLGSAVNVNYDKDFKNTKLGLKFYVNSLDSDSVPTIYHYNKKTQIFKPIETQVIGDMAYANINESGAYTVIDKNKQDEVNKLATDYVINDVEDEKITSPLNTKNKGRSIVFAIDSSGSMVWNDKGNLRLSLTKKLLAQLDKNHDRVSILDFDDTINIKKSLTNNIDDALLDVDKIDSSGGTDIYNAIKESIELLKSESNNKKYIFLLTDGDDYSSYDEVISEAIKNNINIFTIGLGKINQNKLAKLANDTGGKFYFAKKSEELPEIFDQFDNDIKQKELDVNKDRISPYYTREILKGKLHLSTGKESPYFKIQIAAAREKISKEYNIQSANIEEINKKIDNLNDEYIESLFAKDYDNDNLVNGNEVRPEKHLDGKAFLYVLSDPEKADTDGDGITDDKDGYIDLELKSNVAIEDVASNTLDTDGDGYDDAFEVNSGKIDSFGEKYSRDKWNVGERDLLLLSEIVYYDFKNDKHRNKSLLKIYNSEKNDDKGEVFGSKNLYSLDLKSGKDIEFFKKWKFMERFTDDYEKEVIIENERDDNSSMISGRKIKEKLYYSDVMLFEDEASKNLIIAFRGTDEGVDELIKDIKILFNKSKVPSIVEEQMKKIKSIISNKNYENIYVTGHSLGGYESYYGFLEASKSFSELVKGVVNFNGPGLSDYVKYEELKKKYDANTASIKAYETDTNVGFNILDYTSKVRVLHRVVYDNTNKLIVHGFGNLKHPKVIEKGLAYLKDTSPLTLDKLNPIYPHKLTSFYAHLSQGNRDTQDKFNIIEKNIINKTIDYISDHAKKMIKGASGFISKGFEKLKSLWK